MTHCTNTGTIRLCGTANIGTKGQIVIPKEARNVLNLKPGDSVSFLLKDEKFLGVVSNDKIDILLEYILEEGNITLLK